MFQPLTQLFNAYLNHGELDPAIREVAILRVGFLLDSEYEVFNHKRAASVIGMDPERVNSVLSNDALESLSSEDQLVVQFVDEVIRDGAPGEASFRAAEELFTVSQLIELSVVIGVYTMVAQICATFEIEPEVEPIADTGLEDIFAAVKKLRDD
ncbi:MAG: carboxymuconolactone decarboxylase family protein [Woeseiaceae bacterium]